MINISSHGVQKISRTKISPSGDDPGPFGKTGKSRPTPVNLERRRLMDKSTTTGMSIHPSHHQSTNRNKTLSSTTTATTTTTASASSSSSSLSADLRKRSSSSGGGGGIGSCTAVTNACDNLPSTSAQHKQSFSTTPPTTNYILHNKRRIQQMEVRKLGSKMLSPTGSKPPFSLYSSARVQRLAEPTLMVKRLQKEPILLGRPLFVSKSTTTRPVVTRVNVQSLSSTKKNATKQSTASSANTANIGDNPSTNNALPPSPPPAAAVIVDNQTMQSKEAICNDDDVDDKMTKQLVISSKSKSGDTCSGGEDLPKLIEDVTINCDQDGDKQQPKQQQQPSPPPAFVKRQSSGDNGVRLSITDDDACKMVVIPKNQKSMRPNLRPRLHHHQQQPQPRDTKQEGRNLLSFIEHSSSELIFLLNESAKLSYQLSLFENKLDCLERIFVTHEAATVEDGAALKCSSLNLSFEAEVEDPGDWPKVIERTRKWIHNVRSSNVFMRKVDSGMMISNKWLQKLRTNGTNSLQSFSRRSTTVQPSSLSSEDELIVLLDRIAQFSSSIMSKRRIGQQNSPLKSTNTKPVDIDSIILEMKPGIKDPFDGLENPKEILKQLFDENSESMNDGEEYISTSGIDIDRDRMYALQPDILKALFNITKTNARLVQIQQKFDEMMCAYLKTTGQSLAAKSSPSKRSKFTGVSLPCNNSSLYRKRPKQAPPPPPPPPPPKCNTSPSQRSKSFQEPAVAAAGPQLTCGGSTEVFHECKSQNHSNCGNFVSDGDSGGEFTATTVTNDFNQSGNEDELSSLLNQIALCSQKLIEQNTSGSAGSGAGGNNSTTTDSSGCCCSTSIEAKCTGSCSIGHNSRFKDYEPPPYLMHHRSWMPPPALARCVCVNKKPTAGLQPGSYVSRHSSLPKQQPYGSYQNCSPYNQQLRNHTTFDNLNELNEATYLKRSVPFSQPNRIRNYIYKQKRWSNEEYYSDQGLSFDNPECHYQRDLINNNNPVKRGSPKRHHDFDGWMHESFNGNANFMLNTSMADVLSPGHHMATESKFNATDCSHTSAFIFDPNVDLESFLYEVEKELDDNCFASAPPFLTRQQQQAAGGGSNFNLHSMMHDHFRCGSPDGSSTVDYSTPLVNHLAAAAPTAAPPVYSSLNSPPSRFPKHIPTSGSTAGQPSIAGANWRLSQRNSIADLGRTPAHFPFPAMTSMPTNTVASSPGDHRYKRVIVPSASRDLLEKFRAQVSYRVTEETENQLREIDDWLHDHLRLSTTAQEGDDLDTTIVDDTDQWSDNVNAKLNQLMTNSKFSNSPDFNLLLDVIQTMMENRCK